MEKTTSHSVSQQKLLLIAMWILVLSGFGFLFDAVSGGEHGLRAWLLPFGPWSCALIAFGVSRRRRH